MAAARRQDAGDACATSTASPQRDRHGRDLDPASPRTSRTSRSTEAVIEEIVKPVLPEGHAERQDQLPHQSDRALRHRRAAWATRGLTGRKIIVDTYGGLAPPRRRRVLRQGPVQGRPLGRLRRALRREEHRRRRARDEVRGAGRLRDRRRAARSACMVDTFGTGKIADDKIAQAGRKALRPAARRASSRRSTCCARSTARPRPTATSAATSRNSPGKRRTRPRR